MNAEIIAVGSELLLGQIDNTNASFLSRQLAEAGINVYYHTVVGDNPGRLEQAIAIAEQRADFIVFTGGLGPTKDDLTKETIARHLGTELVSDEEAMRSIEMYFERTGRAMTENNKKQALVLKGSQVLRNDNGMAPGMLYSNKSHLYMLLPGPPHEMQPMMLKYGLAAILNKQERPAQIVSRVLRFFGIGEAMLETEIEDILDSQTNPTVAPLATRGEVTLRLTAKHELAETAMAMLDETEAKIMARAGRYFYGYDDTSLVNELSKLLEEQGLTISCAESLTGGMFQKELTSRPGAGSLLKGGIVCYTNEAKLNVVNVSKETIERYGVVSGECAAELAENTRGLFNSDVGISFTGVAGPEELEGQPVGTVFIGISIKGRPIRTEKIKLGGDRESNRVRSVKYGCHFLIESLKNSQDA